MKENKSLDTSTNKDSPTWYTEISTEENSIIPTQEYYAEEYENRPTMYPTNECIEENSISGKPTQARLPLKRYVFEDIREPIIPKDRKRKPY